MSDIDKMSLVGDSSTVSSSMSIESTSNSFKMEIEDMLVATQAIIQSVEYGEKLFTDLQKNIVLQNYQPTYIIVSPEDTKMKLEDVLDILQSTSDATTFGSNMLKFLQNSKNITIN